MVMNGWGLDVNRIEAKELLLELEQAQPDISLLTGRYTLLGHERELQRVMPEVKNVKGMVAAGPYSSGILVGGQHIESG